MYRGLKIIEGRTRGRSLQFRIAAGAIFDVDGGKSWHEGRYASQECRAMLVYVHRERPATRTPSYCKVTFISSRHHNADRPITVFVDWASSTWTSFHLCSCGRRNMRSFSSWSALVERVACQSRWKLVWTTLRFRLWFMVRVWLQGKGDKYVLTNQNWSAKREGLLRSGTTFPFRPASVFCFVCSKMLFGGPSLAQKSCVSEYIFT